MMKEIKLKESKIIESEKIIIISKKCILEDEYKKSGLAFKKKFNNLIKKKLKIFKSEKDQKGIY